MMNDCYYNYIYYFIIVCSSSPVLKLMWSTPLPILIGVIHTSHLLYKNWCFLKCFRMPFNCSTSSTQVELVEQTSSTCVELVCICMWCILAVCQGINVLFAFFYSCLFCLHLFCFTLVLYYFQVDLLLYWSTWLS